MSKIKVIVGPPCAGKTSYVLAQMKAGDVRIDYDEIAKSFGSNKSHDATGPVRQVALAARQSAIYRVMRGVESDAWVIHTNPRAEMLKDYDIRDAEFIMVNPGKEECLARAANRPEGTTDAIEEWFASPPTLPKHETVKMTQPPDDDYGERIIRAVKRHVDEATEPLLARIKELESREPLQGVAGDAGEDGADGRDGKDAEPLSEAAVADSVAANFERRFADLSLTWERAARDMAEKAIDKMPAPKDGADGKDGRDFEQPVFEYDGARQFTIRSLVDGEEVAQTFTIPLVVDAGFYKDGTQYVQGDGVTFAGSFWIAQKSTDVRPEIGIDDWRLCVKRGRDAKAREVPL